MTRKLLLAATILAPLPAFMGQAVAQPVTGIYIGAEGGANFLQRETLQTLRTGAASVNYVNVHNAFNDGYVGLASIGYGLGNGLRLELEGNYRYNGLTRPSRLTSTAFGGKEEKYGGMANVLFDLDVGSPYAYPYIGGGLGYVQVDQTSRIQVPGLSQRVSGSEGSFAYQAIAGVSFPIPPVVGLSLTAEYRFYALAGDRTFSYTQTAGIAAAGRQSTTDNYNHSLLLGLRYAFNVAPPSVPNVPAVPTDSGIARSYLVFFDWDRADLTDRARQIIAAAAQATTQTQVTRIEVSGHTDTTGSAQYNQGLSVRRAQNVAAELVRLGVPRAAITTQGFGFSRPLVSTGPGVREPQNRRVEIVMR